MAIVSVGASALVAITVPIVSARFEHRRLRLDQNNSALEELRAVLDQGALALASGEAALRQLELDAERIQKPGGFDEGAGSTEVVRPAVAAVRVVWEQRFRIGLRLGSQAEISRVYARAMAALQVELSVLEAALHDGASSDDEVEWTRVAAAVGDARDTFRAAQQAFLDSASVLVGPKFS